MPPGQGAGGGRGPRRVGRGRRPPEAPDSAAAARGRAIGLLARRDYPRDLLKDRLTESGFEPGAAEAAVCALEDERLVNDARYVENALAIRTARGQGPIRIALELRRLGVARELVAGAVDARAPEWGQRAAALRRRRFGAAVPADRSERARQVRFLLQRGFTGAQVRHALGSGGQEMELLLEDERADAGAVYDEPAE